MVHYREIIMFRIEKYVAIILNSGIFGKRLCHTAIHSKPEYSSVSSDLSQTTPSIPELIGVARLTVREKTVLMVPSLL